MRGKAQNNDVVLLCILQKLYGCMGVVTIHYQQTWGVRIASLGCLWFKDLFHPKIAQFLICPTLR
jgi:hypothetical protein